MRTCWWKYKKKERKKKKKESTEGQRERENWETFKINNWILTFELENILKIKKAFIQYAGKLDAVKQSISKLEYRSKEITNWSMGKKNGLENKDYKNYEDNSKMV
jgi:hypothetical protein